MLRVAFVMMQKDEEFLLAPWIEYHGNLFGYENLFIFDNGSLKSSVLQILEKYENLGVHVDRTKNSREDYLNKGKVVGNLINNLDKTDYYDFFFPTDCDEFLALRTDWGFSCSRDEIFNEIQKYLNEPKTLKIPLQIANHPKMKDFYYYFTFHKTFFARNTFGSTDHGHHLPGSRKAEPLQSIPKTRPCSAWAVRLI